MDSTQLIENMAVASQHRPLVEDKIVSGAVLRSIHQWLEANHSPKISMSDLLGDLKSHPSFYE